MTRFDVRRTAGPRIGTIGVHNNKDLLRGYIRFARMINTRFHGLGFLELESFEQRLADPSFATLDLQVSQWATLPAIGKHGGYLSGRVDYVLIFDGPIEWLRQIRTFEEEAA